MAAKAKVLVARHSFIYDAHGEQLHIHGGERLRPTHPAVKGREAFFDEVTDVDQVEEPRKKAKGKR